MPKAPHPPHCILKRRQYFARLGIPTDVRAALGRKWFIVPLGESDPGKAYSKSLPILNGWRDRIKAARLGLADPDRAEAERLTREYAQYIGKPLDNAGHALIADSMAWLFRRQGGILTAVNTMGQQGIANAVAQALPATTPTVWAGVQTPFLAHLDAWKAQARNLATVTITQYEAILREFDKALNHPMIETLTAKQAQAWINSELDRRNVHGDPINPRTVKRKVTGALSNYWGYLQDEAQGYAPADYSPFVGRKYNDGMTSVERAEQAKVRFAPIDVPKLWDAATATGTDLLSEAITLAVYMGWRQGELVELTTANVKIDSETGVRYVHGGKKTECGVRDVPIHPEIEGLVDRLVATAGERGGYLIGGTPKRIGEAFTTLKTDLGYDRRRSFHSLRHTYAHLLRNAPRNVLKDLLGHEGRDTTDGYLGDSPLDERRAALIKGVRFTAHNGTR